MIAAPALLFSRFEASKLLVVVAGACVFALAASLVAMFGQHIWIADVDGAPIVVDFIEVWVAGVSALGGHAASAYDWQAHHAAQVAVVGHPFEGYLGWHYPPFALFIAAFVALFPYATAFGGWVAATTAAYAAAVRAITGEWRMALFACAAPAVFANALPGQNGCFTAALMGAALAALPGRPVLAGVFLGLLTYKPQLGILFPVALIAGAHWRMFASATVTAALGIALSWLAFGSESYAAFFHFLPITAQSVLGDGSAGWEKMQSVYGLVRWLGAPDNAGWMAQVATTMSCVAGIFWLWRRDAPFALKAAALVGAAMLATPYLYMYDFPILIVAIAFLRQGGAFDRTEWRGVIGANLLFCAYPLTAIPLGPVIVSIVLWLIVRRLARGTVGAGVPQVLAAG